jgi:hypothetical protein
VPEREVSNAAPDPPAAIHAVPRHIWVLLGVMVFLWSVNFVVSKIALREFPPLLAGALRLLPAR